jgi:hypothetical protein
MGSVNRRIVVQAGSGSLESTRPEFNPQYHQKKKKKKKKKRKKTSYNESIKR